MATGSAVFKLGLAAVFVCFAVDGRVAEASLSCGQVVNALTPCISYVTGGALQPACCNGVQGLYKAAQTAVDRQSVCRCLKSVINGASYGSQTAALAAGLPAKCGVHLPYKISPSTDCNTVTK